MMCSVNPTRLNAVIACLTAFHRYRLLGNLEDSVILPHLSVAKEVRDKLGLPLWLAAKYTAVVFLLHVRFHVSDGVRWQRSPRRLASHSNRNRGVQRFQPTGRTKAAFRSNVVRWLMLSFAGEIPHGSTDTRLRRLCVLLLLST